MLFVYYYSSFASEASDMLDPYPITQSMEVEFEPGTTEYDGDQYFSEHPEAMMALLSQDPYT